jgi:hypothetical protein
VRRRDFLTRAGLASAVVGGGLSSPAELLRGGPEPDVSVRLAGELSAYRAALEGMRRKILRGISTAL